MLDAIGITNFKAFARQDLALAPFTLLTGLNSSGKSSVLQSLALLRQSFEAGLLDEVDDMGGLLLNGELVELGTGQDVRHDTYVRHEVNIPDDRNIVLSVTTDGVPYEWRAEYGREDDLLRLLSRPVQPVSSTSHDLRSLFGRRFQYLKADRIVPAVSYPRSHEAAVRRGFLGARGEHTVNFLRAHQDDSIKAESLCLSEASSTTLLSQTDAWMQRLCPGVNLQAVGIDGTDTVRLSYGFGAGVSASNRYRPTNVGFGLTYALPIVVACLSARPDSLILLENPEAHLHPQGQTWLAYLAAAAVGAGAQVIMETHSDHVLNGLRLRVKQGKLPAASTAVHFFRRKGQSTDVVTPVIADDGTLSDWPMGFFDEWENSLDQLLD
ncbi:AAA family ATPase [Streptomyces sp. NPDC055775]